MTEMTENKKDFIDLAIDDYLSRVARKANEEAKGLAEQAKIRIREHYKYRKHQLYALVLLLDGDVVQRPQDDHAISEENVCSEINCLNAYDGDVPMSKLVVAHKKTIKEGSVEHIVTPCELCRAEYYRNYPMIEVIIWYEGELWVVPLRALLTMPYGQVIGFDSPVVIENDPVKAEMDALFAAVGREANAQEQDMAREVKIVLERNNARKNEKFFSLARTDRNTTVYGPPARVQKGPYPCSELSIYSRITGTGTCLRTIVCAFIGSDGMAHIGGLCEPCKGRFLARYPGLEVIVEWKGKLWVIPIRVLLLLPYKTRNGDEHVFTGETGQSSGCC